MFPQNILGCVSFPSVENLPGHAGHSLDVLLQWLFIQPIEQRLVLIFTKGKLWIQITKVGQKRK